MFKSEIESNIFKLNFYRSDADFFINYSLKQQKEILLKNKIDIVRFSMSSIGFDLSNEFCAFKNYSFLNTILHYEKDTTKLENFLIDPDYELKEAIPDEKDDIVKLIENVFEFTPFGYSNIPFLKDKISTSQELQTLQAYLLDLFNQANSGIQLFKNKIDDEIVGFSSYSINNQNQIYRAYAGIIPSKRNIKLYEKLVYSMIHYNYEHQINAITFGARADNLVLINKFSRVGCKVTSINYNFLALV